MWDRQWSTNAFSASSNAASARLGPVAARASARLFVPEESCGSSHIVSGAARSSAEPRTTSTGVNVLLVALVPGVFLLGLLLARRLRRRRPEVHASFAAEPPEDGRDGLPDPPAKPVSTSVTL